MSWSRLRQATRETFKSSGKTEIPTDVNNLMLKGQGVANLYLELAEKAEVEYPLQKVSSKNANNPVKTQPLYILSNCFELLASEYMHYHPESSTFFKQAQKTIEELAKHKYDLDVAAHTEFIGPKRDLVEERVRESESRMEQLKLRRLELDATKHKLKTQLKKEDEVDDGKKKKREMKVESAQQKFEGELETIRRLLTPVANDVQMARAQSAQAARLLKSMKEHYLKCYQALDLLDQTVSFDETERVMSSTGSSFSNVPQRVSVPASPISTKPSRPASMIATTPRTKAPPPPPPTASSNQHVLVSDAPPVLKAKPTVPVNQLNPWLLQRQQQAQSPSQHSGPSPVPSGSVAGKGARILRPVSMQPPVLQPKPSVEIVKALYDFEGVEATDLSFVKNDVIEIVSKKPGEAWWQGINRRTGQKGMFPNNYVS